MCGWRLARLLLPLELHLEVGGHVALQVGLLVLGLVPNVDVKL